MKASGMCGSDLKFYRSAPGEAQKSLGFSADAEPFIGGHEPCGVVAARGPGVSEKEAPIGAAGHGPPLRRLRRVQALPRRLVAALQGGHHGLRRHRPRRPRASTSRCRCARWCRCPTSCPSSPAPRCPAAPAPPTARCGACTSPAARRSRCSARGRSASARRCSARRWARASSRWRRTPSAGRWRKKFGADAIALRMRKSTSRS